MPSVAWRIESSWFVGWRDRVVLVRGVRDRVVLVHRVADRIELVRRVAGSGRAGSPARRFIPVRGASRDRAWRVGAVCGRDELAWVDPAGCGL